MEQRDARTRFWKRPPSVYLPTLLLLAASLLFLGVFLVLALPRILHIYDETVIPATCGKNGYTLHTCRLCDAQYEDNYTYIEHSYSAPYTVRWPSETTIGIAVSRCHHCGDVKRTELPLTLTLPTLNFSGILPVKKDAPATVTLNYFSSATAFETVAEARVQGLTSAYFPKQNYNLRFYTDGTLSQKQRVDLGYGEWGEQWKYTLKANWIDRTHARNIVTCRIFAATVETRKTPNEELLSAPNNGVTDGFPVRVYHDGEYYGLYTLNIAKDKWMYGMDEATYPRSAIITAQMHNASNRFQKTTDLANTEDWDLEYCSTGTDIDWVNKSFNDFITFVMETDDRETFRARAEEYMDVEAVIDYIWMYTVVYGTDNINKNVIFVTYDGKRWIPNYYDADSSWALHWTGTSFFAESSINSFVPKTITKNRAVSDNLLHARVAYFYYEEFRDRYWELRRGPLSNASMIAAYEEFFSSIPEEVYAEDRAKWQDIPNATDEFGYQNDMEQLRAYINRRMAVLDNAVRSMRKA